MHTPQPGVLAESSQHSIYLTYNLTSCAGALDRVRSFLRAMPQIQARESTREVPVLLTVGIGASIWSDLAPRKPSELKPFPAMESGVRVAPSTPTDLFISIRSDSVDCNIDLLAEVQAMLADSVALVEEIRGFRYHDMRDLTGFVDGTENPDGEHRADVALSQELGFEAGSYLHVQRYEHDLDKWNRVPVPQQEQTYGRTKQDNVEFSSVDKSPHAHTKRASLKDDSGNSIEILRHSMPYGDATRRGLLFLSFAASAEPFTKMLHSMIYGDEQGNADNLLLYTRAVTGSAYFVPSLNWLEQL